MTAYLDFCEELFQNWLNHRLDLSDFDADFQVEHVPEPYYILKEGKKPLYVLNYNPGEGLPQQTRKSILAHPHDSYCAVAKRLSEFYRNEFTGKAIKRNEKILKFAKAMGYDGVVCVETFFLHSANWPIDKKMAFVESSRKNKLVQKYNRVLKNFLKSKPVLRVSAVSTKKIINLKNRKTFSNVWVKYQNDIMGVDLNSMTFVPIPPKGKGRVTSCIYVGKKEKYVSFMMGGNNLPKLNQERYTKLSKAK